MTMFTRVTDPYEISNIIVNLSTNELDGQGIVYSLYIDTLLLIIT